MKCEICNEESIETIQVGTLIYRCPSCKWYGPATSYRAVIDMLQGVYEVMEIDEELDPVKIIGKGTIAEYKTIIETELAKGRLIALKKTK